MNRDKLLKVYLLADLDQIKATIKHQKVWKWSSDDSADFQNFAPSQEGIWLAADIGEYAGCFWFHPETVFMWQVHTCLLPNAWGLAEDLARLAIRWMFENTPCQKLITWVPKNNPLALKLAEKSGFEVEGIIKRSFMKNGILLDQTILGLSRS